MLLAIDTSTQRLGIAFYSNSEVHGETIWHSPNYHTAQLAPMITETLSRMGLSMSSVKAIGVALGPGGFTGLRVGLALAKGLALAADIPIIGIPSMDILATGVEFPHWLGVKEAHLATLLQAGRGRLSVGWYTRKIKEDHWQHIMGKDQLLNMISLREALIAKSESQGTLIPTILCGELMETERRDLEQTSKALPKHSVNLASVAQSVRRPSILAELAWKRWQNDDLDNPDTLAPLYLHEQGRQIQSP